MTASDAQTSLLVQSSEGFSATEHETCQVLYADNHWIAAGCGGGKVVIANSMGETIPPVLVKQLKQLYIHQMTSDGGLVVDLLQCAQQSNGSDCGFFAVAFLFEWATAHSLNIQLEVKFRVPAMRAHLVRCLEKGEITASQRFDLVNAASQWV